MANTFIAKKADMINLDVASKAQLNRLEDFTKVICDKATSVKNTIEAIETIYAIETIEAINAIEAILKKNTNNESIPP